MYESIAIFFILACASCILVTFLARMLALRVGLVDSPDGRAELQTRPVAVCGGVALFFSLVTTLVVGNFVFSELHDLISDNLQRCFGLLVASIIISFFGLMDDFLTLRARHKLIGQFIAILFLIYLGDFRIEHLSLFGQAFDLGVFSLPLTIFWMLAAINALNLIDGMDGLLGTVGLIVALAIAGMAFVTGHAFVAWIAVALAGALVGFLRFNLPPASVYLGDCGSMLIGLLVGAMALEASLKGPTLAILTPAALLVLPFLDTSAAIVRRKLTGRGLAVTDRGHLHHELQRRGLTRGRILILTSGLGAMAAIGAVMGRYLQNDFIAGLSAASVILVLLASGLFGTAEVRLIKERTSAVFHSMKGTRSHVELTVHLQGTADWANVWRSVVRLADELHIHSVRLDVNAPYWHEGFHARWDRMVGPIEEMGLWKFDLPVVGHGQVLGRLSVSGVRSDDGMSYQLERLSAIIAEAEAAAARTVAPPSLNPVAVRAKEPGSKVIAPAPAA